MRQVVVTALRRRTCEVRAILHAGKQSHSQGGAVHTEEGDVTYWAHCVSILRFLGKGKLSREEGKVWEGEKGERTDLRQCVRAGSMTMHHVPLTLTFLAFLHLSFFSREFSLSQNS